MSKLSFFLILTLVLAPGLAEAVSDEQRGYAEEIGQQWVIRHNDKLKDIVKKAAGLFSGKKKGLVNVSLHVPELKKKALKPEEAEDFGVPSQVVNNQGVTVGLMGLYRTAIKFEPGAEHTFITAEYYDDLDPIHSSSDVYMKIGRKYFLFFHGEGYPHCAKILWLDNTQKDSPVFFEISQFGGGSRVQKTLYTLDKNAVATIPQTLFDVPESIRKEDYIHEKLTWSSWLDGETSYVDVMKDGNIEILSLSESGYPAELNAKLQEKYGFVNTDYTEPFRRALSVYQWNDTKQTLDDLGDYYY
ncbi:MAG TPA: hypothetical protein VK791_03265 [bacterium]|jgi:hypothetical protein|nr:hypothetical protein [bacterium]